MEPAHLAIVTHIAGLPSRDRWILRGGLVMRRYLAPMPRPVEDVDYLLLVDDMEGLRELARSAYDVDYETTWEETQHPALRADIPVGGASVRIDLGWGDPMPIPPVDMTFGDIIVRVPAAEQLFAWKVHGLFERGRGRWRAKDLYDLYGMIENADMDRDLIPECIATAFESRGDDAEAMTAVFFAGEMGLSRGSRRKWRKLRETRPDAPEDHLPILEAVRSYLRPLVPF